MKKVFCKYPLCLHTVEKRGDYCTQCNSLKSKNEKGVKDCIEKTAERAIKTKIVSS